AGPAGRRADLPAPPRPDRERARANPLRPDERAPRAHVETEERADEDHVGRPYPHTPHDASVLVGDHAPVAAGDPEGRRATGRTGRSVDVAHLGWLDARVVAERWLLGLRAPRVVLPDDGAALEVLERADALGMDAGLRPLPPVERRLVPAVAHDLANALEDRRVAIAGGHGLPPSAPKV